MPTFELKRSGQRPLTLAGQLLAKVDGFNPHRDLERYHTIAVYRTAAGRYAVAISLTTHRDGEPDHYLAEHADTPEAIEDVVKRYNPCPPGIGFPPQEHYRERQERLLADLTRRYDRLVVDLFTKLGSEFAEEIA